MRLFITDYFEHGVVALDEYGSCRRRKSNVFVTARQASGTPVPRVFKVRVRNPAQNFSFAAEHAYCNENQKQIRSDIYLPKINKQQ